MMPGGLLHGDLQHDVLRGGPAAHSRVKTGGEAGLRGEELLGGVALPGSEEPLGELLLGGEALLGGETLPDSGPGAVGATPASSSSSTRTSGTSFTPWIVSFSAVRLSTSLEKRRVKKSPLKAAGVASHCLRHAIVIDKARCCMLIRLRRPSSVSCSLSSFVQALRHSAMTLEAS